LCAHIWPAPGATDRIASRRNLVFL